MDIIKHPGFGLFRKREKPSTAPERNSRETRRKYHEIQRKINYFFP